MLIQKNKRGLNLTSPLCRYACLAQFRSSAVTSHAITPTMYPGVSRDY